jgi:hypothetical protein
MTYCLIVRSVAGDVRHLISHESPENPVSIVVNEYGTFVESKSPGQYGISGLLYSEVSRQAV